MRKAEIITIGDEILIGQVVDTNSAWMAEKLNLAGIAVVQITSISDRAKHIIEALDKAQERADLILITGGLGPTNDDITKKTLADYFGGKLVESAEAMENIKRLLANRGVPVINLNKEQALVPDNCTPIPNVQGTAMALWFEQNEKVFVSMPGVPYEMKTIMEDEILPRLSSFSDNIAIEHKTILVVGYPESVLSDKLKHWEANLPTDLKLAYLPSPGKIRMRFSIAGIDRTLLKQKIEEQITMLKEIIPDSIANFDASPIQETVGQLLRKYGKTVSTAESCTGGKIAHYFTSIPGSSDYFQGSVVAYSNKVKAEVLGVSNSSLEQFGAVSKEVVEGMAQGARTLFGTDYTVATSGIAGPGGGTKEKPVGTTWIAVASSMGTKSEVFVMGTYRERNIEKSTITALDLLRKLILQENDS